MDKHNFNLFACVELLQKVKKKKKVKTILIAILVIGFVCFAFLKVNRFIEIDKCLDNGNRWHYSANKCECENKRKVNIEKITVLK